MERRMQTREGKQLAGRDLDELITTAELGKIRKIHLQTVFRWPQNGVGQAHHHQLAAGSLPARRALASDEAT
jgi:hypothetical protein